MRQRDERVGRITLEELQRGGVVGPSGGVGYSEGYVEGVEGEDELDDSDDEEKASRKLKTSERQLSTPLLPRPKKASKKAPPTTPRSKLSSSQRPQTTPGGSNFNDLLRAAELATRPESPTPLGTRSTPIPMSSARTATLSRVAEDEDSFERGSPAKKARTGEPSWSGASGTEDEASALDLLAQASQLEGALPRDSEAQIDPTLTRLGEDRETPRAATQDSALAPAIALRAAGAPAPPVSQQDVFSQSADTHQAPPAAQATPVTQARATSTLNEVKTPARSLGSAYEDSPYNRAQSPPSSAARTAQDAQGALFSSPPGPAVPGLGKYTHLTSSMPAKRVRSPYLKWTVEEDELLARAVAMHGEKWDLVSKGVPTRSYHQVRQRWLRKTGAFDKKAKIQQETPTQMTIDQEGEEEEDEEGGSPTPGGMRGKQRKADQLVFHEYEVEM